MRLLLLLFVVSLGLSTGAVSSFAVRPLERRPPPVSVAGTALAELQRAVGTVATVTAAAAGGQLQETEFSKAAAGVTETKAGVRVPLAGGKVVQLKNVPPQQLDETTVETYHYRGAEAKTGLVWVTKEAWESTKQLLVSRPSGRVTEIGNEPHLNAAGTLLFARQNDCFQVFEDCFPGFQLWRVQAGQLQPLQPVRLEHYFVLAGHWLGPNRLRLELGSIEELMDKGEVAKVRRLTFELTVKP